MRLTNRFKITRPIKEDRQRLTFLGSDKFLERPDLLIKIASKGTFGKLSREVAGLFSWHCGIGHRHVAKILDAGSSSKEDIFWIREYYEGVQASVSADPIVVGQLLSAVSMFHSDGRTHGNIKPSNIFPLKTGLVLADPRIMPKKQAEMTEEDIRFSAPEVLRGLDPTRESDLYSIGMILYRAFSGKDPFDDFHLENLRAKYMWASPKALTSVCHAPKEVSDAVERLLDKDPHRRPNTGSIQALFSQAGIPGYRAPLKGREEELRICIDFINRGSGRRLRVLMIEGLPGIGKTRLMEELRTVMAFSSSDFIMTGCTPKDSTGLEPFLSAVEQIIRRRSFLNGSGHAKDLEHFSALSSHFTSNRKLRDGQPYFQERLISECLMFLRSAALRNPLTVVLENVNLARSATLKILQQLFVRSLEIPLNLILTRRLSQQPFEMHSVIAECLGTDLLTLKLKPLATSDATSCLGFVTATPEHHDYVLRAAAGIPLFIEELGTNAGGDKLSQRLQVLVKSVLATLTDPASEVVLLISIFHEPVRRELIQRISQLSEHQFEAALNEISLTSLVITDCTSISFRTEELRKVVASRMPPQKRVRLHKTAFEMLSQENADKGVLALHAYRGRFFEEAARLCTEIATNLCARGNYSAAIYYYRFALSSLRPLNRSLHPQAKSDLALCYARVGKSALAKKTYRELASAAPSFIQGSNLLSSIYESVAPHGKRNPVPEQIRLYSQIIAMAPPDSPTLGRWYAYLSQFLTLNGDLDDAATALTQAELTLQRHPSERTRVLIQLTRGYVLLQSGKFRDAINLLTSIKTGAQNILAAIFTNVAVCWDHLGNFKKARHYQLRSKEIADSTGEAFGRIISLNNLAAFETKAGAFREAFHLFNSGRALMNQLRSRDRGLRLLSIYFTDLGILNLETGNYRQANEDLKKAIKYPAPSLEKVSITLALCTLRLCFRDFSSARRLLRTLELNPAFKTDFYLIERCLIESDFHGVPADHKMLALATALEKCAALGTRYQQCRLLIKAAALLRELGRDDESHRLATQAVDIAQMNRYRALMARSFLMSGLTAKKSADRKRLLLAAFHTASEIGLLEVVGETAFYLGTEFSIAGDHFTAREYLGRSTSIILQLAQEIPPRFRAKYLECGWRKDANGMLKQCESKIEMASGPNGGRAELRQEDSIFFQSLYKLTASVRRVENWEDLVRLLLETVESELHHVAIVTLKNGVDVFYRTSISLDRDLAAQIELLRDKCGRNLYFGSLEKATATNTIAWIPLCSSSWVGGIYVECGPNQHRFSEKEMEFLTILGTIGSGGLEQLQHKETVPVLVSRKADFQGIIGSSVLIRQVHSQIELAATNNATVLVEGETGTGKELVARAIHQTSERAKGCFIAVDCGAIPEGLIEAELFGSKKGAYTGAISDRAGLFEAAGQGTIFLDEISNTSGAVQAKLLRVLQEREVRRIGETRDRKIDVRLIAASNKNLDTLAQEGRFRKDLLYRLKVLHITIPPLRERREDIPMLVQAFLDRLNTTHKTNKRIARAAVAELSLHTFPGNVRELQNAVERAFFTTKGAVIDRIAVETATDAVSIDEVQALFKEVVAGRSSFWSAIHSRYKRRDIPREKVLTFVDLGLRSSGGSYKEMASMFHLNGAEYRRFMDFLRRNKCLLDFRPYRRAASEMS